MGVEELHVGAHVRGHVAGEVIVSEQVADGKKLQDREVFAILVLVLLWNKFGVVVTPAK